MALPRLNRLAGKKNFEAVSRRGKAVYDSFFLLKALRTGVAPSRFGIAIPSRVIKSAVQRNRIRRVLSEAIRSRLPAIPRGFDVILVLRKALPSDQEARRAAIAAVVARIDTLHG